MSKVILAPDEQKFMRCYEQRLTVYFPRNCANTCPFCTSRGLYSMYGTNEALVLETLKALSPVGPRPDTRPGLRVVNITGGEPAYDLELLDRMLTAVGNPPWRSETVHVNDANVYVNTTGLRENMAEFNKLINGRVNGVSISRHMDTLESDETLLHGIVDDTELYRLGADLRVNAVLCRKRDSAWYRAVMDRWLAVADVRIPKNTDLSFRMDYNKVSLASLHDPNPEEALALMSVPGVEYVGRTSCDVCDNLIFRYKNRMNVRLHRGLANTRLTVAGQCQVESLVLFQDGLLATDWDRSRDGLEEALVLMYGEKVAKKVLKLQEVFA